MVLSSLVYLSLLGVLGIRRRPPLGSEGDDLDVALAGAQVGLERKRRRWLLFLIEKEERLTTRLAQVTADVSTEATIDAPTEVTEAAEYKTDGAFGEVAVTDATCWHISYTRETGGENMRNSISTARTAQVGNQRQTGQAVRTLTEDPIQPFPVHSTPSSSPNPPTPPTLTYDPELGPGYFVQTRSDFLRFPGFSPTAKVLYLVLCSYAGAGVDAWPGQVRLARECGVSERTIRYVTSDLVRAGLLTVKQQGLNRPNLYHVHKLPITFPPAPPSHTTPLQTVPTLLPVNSNSMNFMKDRQNLPVQENKGDRQNLPVRSGNNFRSRPAESAEELHPVELHPVKRLTPPPSPSTGSTGSKSPLSLVGSASSTRHNALHIPQAFTPKRNEHPGLVVVGGNNVTCNTSDTRANPEEKQGLSQKRGANEALQEARKARQTGEAQEAAVEVAHPPEARSEAGTEAGIAGGGGGGGDRGRFGSIAQTTAARASDGANRRTGEARQTPTAGGTGEARQTPTAGGTGETIQADRQAEADARLLHERVGVDMRTARGLALLVQERRLVGLCSVGYVAEVVQYATSAHGVRNPAGCVVELIRRNERRSPPNHPKPDKYNQPSSRSSQSHQPSQHPTHEPFDIEKYTTGKYSFLFQRQLQRQAEQQSQQEGSSWNRGNEDVNRDNGDNALDDGGAKKDGGEKEWQDGRTEGPGSKA